MKSVREPVVVMLNNGKPISVIWNMRHYRVQKVEERWRYRGKWWTTPQLAGLSRAYYRVSCNGANRIKAQQPMVTMEIYREGGQWYLDRMQD